MDPIEEFSIGAMLPNVEMDNKDDIIDHELEQEENNQSKVIKRMFESIDLSLNDKIMEEQSNGIDIVGFVFFEETIDWTMESGKDIDEDIKDVIKTLNDKGYITKYSCSGHPSGRVKKDKYRDGILNKKLYSTARVVFVKDYDLPNVPKYWELKILDEDKAAIYVKPPNFKIEDGLPVEAFNKWKQKYMNSLKNWVSDLPKQGEKKKDDVTVESVIDDLLIDGMF